METLVICDRGGITRVGVVTGGLRQLSHTVSPLHLSACSERASEGAVRVAWGRIARGRNRARVSK